ncbi:MAG TPA: chemotaxis protein CheX [Labilithrix sp.]|jgi:hypothetical protein|nr:chemotaxis protein CheX [Labilithrix sp.]
MSMNGGDITNLTNILIESCREASDLLGLELSRVEPKEEFACHAPVAAVVGICGEGLRATVTTVAPYSFMCETYPLELKKGADAALDVLDWTGEIANQIVGMVTNRLASTGVEAYASIPKVILTEHLSNVSLARGSLCELRFVAKAGCMGIWLDAVSGSGNEGGTKVESGGTSAAGALVIF